MLKPTMTTICRPHRGPECRRHLPRTQTPNSACHRSHAILPWGI